MVQLQTGVRSNGGAMGVKLLGFPERKTGSGLERLMTRSWLNLVIGIERAEICHHVERKA
jgi:hypothetical protein